MIAPGPASVEARMTSKLGSATGCVLAGRSNCASLQDLSEATTRDARKPVQHACLGNARSGSMSWMQGGTTEKWFFFFFFFFSLREQKFGPLDVSCRVVSRDRGNEGLRNQAMQGTRNA